MGWEDKERKRIEAAHNDPRTTDQLILKALSQEDDTAYWETVWVLRRRVGQEVLGAARNLLWSELWQERELGVYILDRFGGSSKQIYYEETTSLLVGLLESETDPVVLTALAKAINKRDMAHKDDIRPLPLLFRLKNHPDPGVRLGVVEGLLWYNQAEAVQALIELSENEDTDTRDWATFGLNQLELDTPEIRKALFNRLEDSDSETRHEAIEGLAKRKDERVKPIILQELASEEVWTLTVEAAGELGDPDFYPLLLKWRENWGEEDLEKLEEALEACKPRT